MKRVNMCIRDSKDNMDSGFNITLHQSRNLERFQKGGGGGWGMQEEKWCKWVSH